RLGPMGVARDMPGQLRKTAAKRLFDPFDRASSKNDRIREWTGDFNDVEPTCLKPAGYAGARYVGRQQGIERYAIERRRGQLPAELGETNAGSWVAEDGKCDELVACGLIIGVDNRRL